ncbi:PAS domain S-box protein [Caenispirillum bisanense]|uniref:PAS domain S-box protein n=1 Tax=Caenispirillum bisanense TaxID=414052 RepID=UPI0031E39EBB
MRQTNRLYFLSLAALLLTAALLAGGYSTIVLTDIEQGLPRRAELVAREAGKLDREVATLDQALAVVVATGRATDAAQAQLMVDFVHARIGTVASLAETVAPPGTLGITTLDAPLDQVETALHRLVAAAEAAGSGGSAATAEREAVAEAGRAFDAVVQTVRDDAVTAGDLAAAAIARQAEKLSAFRTSALLVLGAGALTLLVALGQLYRQHLTAAALRDSQMRYRRLFEDNGAMMLVVDLQAQRVVDANAAAAAFYGWSLETLRGMPLATINPLSASERRAELDRAASENRRHLYMQHCRADGSLCDVEVHAAPVVVDGRPLELCVVHDISGRREAERMLSETEQRYRKIVDSATQGFCFVAPGTGSIIDVNPSLCRMLGYEREEMLGRPAVDFLTGPDRELLVDQLRQAALTQHRSYELTLTRKDGGKVLTRFNATTLRDGAGVMRGSYAFIDDITEQRAFERRLAESEAMLRSITANIPGVLYQWYERPDGSRGFHWVSPRSLEILGIPQKELERDWRVLTIHPEDVPRWQASIRQAVETSSDWSFEGRFILPGGRIMWWRGLARPVVTATETLFNGIVFDITHQKELEAALGENRRLLDLALEAGQVGVWDLDLKTGAVWFSPSWKAQLGYADDEFENTMEAWRAVIFPEDAEAAMALVDAYLAGRAETFEALQRFRHRDGSTVYIRTRAQAVRDDATGEPIRLIGAHVDLTPQIQAQEKLAQAGIHTALILDSTADGLYGLDLAGNLTFANASCQRLLGFSEEELIGRNMHLLTHHTRADGSPYPADDCPVFKVLRDGSRREQMDEMLWRKDGAAMPVEMSAAPMTVDGRVVGAIVSFRDVTERQKYKTELERSNAELEQFAYAASHDLQEPLRGVTSYLSLLKRRHGAGLDPAVMSFVDQAMDSALRMTTMIRDLLTYSRVSTRGQQMVPTDAGACIAMALANLRIAITEAEAEVVVDGELPHVRADTGQLTSLFQNLIGNAVKYRDRSRRPFVRVRVEPAPGRRWKFSISDNGIGIEAAYLERIFLPFQRLHGHDQYEGTGIGLAVCRKVVERHGGRLTVTSTPGEGSVFTFDLEAAAAPDELEWAPAKAPAEAAAP